MFYVHLCVKEKEIRICNRVQKNYEFQLNFVICVNECDLFNSLHQKTKWKINKKNNFIRYWNTSEFRWWETYFRRFFRLVYEMVKRDSLTWVHFKFQKEQRQRIGIVLKWTVFVFSCNFLLSFIGINWMNFRCSVIMCLI